MRGRLREAFEDAQLIGAAVTNLSVCCGLRDLASTASAAESFRSRWGSVRGAPVWSSQASPTAAPHVIHGTEDICFGVSSLVFTTAECNTSGRKTVLYCTFLIYLRERRVSFWGIMWFLAIVSKIEHPRRLPF